MCSPTVWPITYITEEEEEEEEMMNCKWIGPIQNSYLHGNDLKTLTNVLAPDCMKACEQEASFKCVSFDYIYSQRKCMLSNVDRSKAKLTIAANYQFYERDCSRKSFSLLSVL